MGSMGVYIIISYSTNVGLQKLRRLPPFPKDSVPLEPPSYPPSRPGRAAFRVRKARAVGKGGPHIIPDLRERRHAASRETARLPAGPTRNPVVLTPAPTSIQVVLSPKAEAHGLSATWTQLRLSSACCSTSFPTIPPALSPSLSPTRGPCCPRETGNIWRPFGCLSSGDVTGFRGSRSQQCGQHPAMHRADPQQQQQQSGSNASSAHRCN